MTAAGDEEARAAQGGPGAVALFPCCAVTRGSLTHAVRTQRGRLLRELAARAKHSHAVGLDRPRSRGPA